MIQITPQMRILLAVEPVDFRKGIEGLVAVCRIHRHVTAKGQSPLDTAQGTGPMGEPVKTE